MKGKIKKYPVGAAGLATGAAGNGFANFMGNYGGQIGAAIGSLMPLFKKKPDPDAKPYKKGTNLIKYQGGNKAAKSSKVLPDTGSELIIRMDDLTDSALNAQAQGAINIPKSSTTGTQKTSPQTGNRTTSNSGLSTMGQAGTAGAAGGVGGILREYGKGGPGKTRKAARVLGEAIRWLAPVVSAEESIRKNRDIKTGDIDYSGALGQFILDQATGKMVKATVRVPYKTVKKSSEQYKVIQEDITKRGITKQEYNAEKKQFRSKEQQAKADDKSIDEKNLINYNKKLDNYNKQMAERAKKKTRGQAPKPPVKPEPVTINQKKLAESDKPYLKYGPRIEITPTSEFAKQAAMEEVLLPGFISNYFKNRRAEKQYAAEGKALEARNRALQMIEENKKKYRRLENTFGLDEKNFIGQLKKSGMSFEDFYQTKLDEFKKKGEKIGERRTSKKEVDTRRQESAQQQRFSPERREQARQNIQRKAQAESERKLIKFKESEQERVAALKESFKENKPSLGYSMIERTRMPVEDITPTPRKSMLLLPESPAAKRKATKAANAAARQATEQRVEGKVKKIKFYGTGNP